MAGTGFLVVWCAVLGVFAALGYGRSLAGTSRAQRAVRVGARIERVDVPPHRADSGRGVPAVLVFQNPADGQILTLPTTGGGNRTLHVAWVGRRIGVRFPPGKPHKFRVVERPSGRVPRGLVAPTIALLLIAAALVGSFAFAHGYGWALLGGGALWTGLMVAALRVGSRRAAERKALLASAVSVPGRVVSVLEHTATDDEGRTRTTYTPVVTFTTYDGTVVTGLCSAGIRDARRSLGRELPVHYAPADPAVFTADVTADRRSVGCGLFFLGLFALGGVALMVVGMGAVL